MFFRPGPARPAINILQNLYNGLKNFVLGGEQKLFKILLSTGIICNLISVNLQSQTCWLLKTNIIFRILGNLKNNLKN